MLSDEAFIRAILADPADDAPWLIYADWLAERGDPRAALYRRPRLANTLGMTFVLVPRGSFWMGDRGRQKPVTIAHEFYLGAYPVAQGQWQAVMGINPSWFSHGGGGADLVQGISDTDLKRFPVEQVSWDDVQEFVERLNAREKDGGLLYRLPAEAGWEYACRGAASSQSDCASDFYTSQPSNDLSSEQANCEGDYPAGNAPAGQFLGRTTQVGSYPPNRLGLYDMHGNVWEWCADLFGGRGSERVVRGGSWGSDADDCGASRRFSSEPSFRGSNLGFRLAAVPSGEQAGRERYQIGSHSSRD
jgi:uncharacterized protein (TIGR02996 family)